MTLQTGTDFSTLPGVNYPVTACDIDTLDAAESLVFWIGGIPKIRKANQTTDDYAVELTGFSRDQNNPLLPEYDPNSAGGGTAGVDYQSNRTETLFQFDPKRLVDSDKDGWPEYVPDFGGTNDETPPYVYFDSGSYGVLPRYPDNNHPVADWGFALPYLIRYTPNSADTKQYPLASNFANADSFQIICAGADNKFGQVPTSIATLTKAFRRLVVYPRGEYYERKNGSNPPISSDWKSIDGEEYDNLTNFTESKLETEFGTSN